MPWIPLANRLSSLPLVLVGPILRRADRDSVTVFVALKDPREITLDVFRTRASERQPDEIDNLVLLTGSRRTVSLGRNLHVAAVTARPTAAGRFLTSGEIYAYNLKFAGGPRPQDLVDAEALIGGLPPERAPTISYFRHRYPTFAMPPRELEFLRIAQGSCRKPHDWGRDGLAILDDLIDQQRAAPFSRPHQLFLTGDQIYAEEVMDPLLWLITDAAETLVGWPETLPGVNATAQELRPGLRTAPMETHSGITAHADTQLKSHILTLGEFYAMYLLVWSEVLWPDSLPTVADLVSHIGPIASATPPDAAFAQGLLLNPRHWRQETTDLGQFLGDLPAVRRALANVPTYTIFDDHDVTDDWYLNHWWVTSVLTQPLGRRLIENGLIAYAVFQAWGNTPAQFEAGSGQRLLEAVARWQPNGLTDDTRRELDAFIGLPPSPGPAAPTEDDGDVRVLRRDRDRVLKWHYVVTGPRHQVIVLDTRTWRGFAPGPGRQTDPPALMSPSAFAEQLVEPLEQPIDGIEATLVIISTNLVGISIIDALQIAVLAIDHITARPTGETILSLLSRTPNDLHATQLGPKLDTGDAWNFDEKAFARMLAAIFSARQRVVLLSGDIHFGYATRLTYWARRHFEASSSLPEPTKHVLAQLTSSAFKNADGPTEGGLLWALHSKAKWAEWEQHWAGWNDHPGLLIRVKLGWNRMILPNDTPIVFPIATEPPMKDVEFAVTDDRYQPDWRYRIEFVRREPMAGMPSTAPVQPIPGLTERLQRMGLVGDVGNVIGYSLLNPLHRDGIEIVGLHNLGIVHFEWPPEDDAKAVVQELYWWPLGEPTAYTGSTYRVSLKLDDPPAPLPVRAAP